jgi:proteic killer suppression protein
MIRNLRHRGLKLLHQRGDDSKLHAAHRIKIARILGYLDVARTFRDMDYPGLRLHPLTGDLSGFWSATVASNWRIIFRFDGVDVADVDLVDYH